MKRNYLAFFLFWGWTLKLMLVSAQPPMSRGVNLTGWFDQATHIRSLPFGKYSFKDLEDIKSLGCDVVRLPVNLHYFTSGAPDYRVDTLLFNYLSQVIQWTHELGLTLIIDNHTLAPANSPSVRDPLLKIWPQMATYFKNAPESVVFEILNEPHDFPASQWHQIQMEIVDTLRKIDTTHWLVVTGADWGGVYGLLNLPPLPYSRLLYSFHFYEPFIFTHQGASWTSPSLAPLALVPWPYDASRMPACPQELKGTWVEYEITTGYKTSGTLAYLQNTLQQVKDFATNHQVPVFCGEMGVYMNQSPELDRVNWYRETSQYLQSLQIPFTMWDYQGGFGLFNKGSNEVFEYDLNRPLGQALNFTLPPYQIYLMRPDTLGFILYDDFFGEGVRFGSVPEGIADVRDVHAFEGQFCIYLANTPQYGALDFDFTFNKDLSLLYAWGSRLDFWYKCNSADASIVLRFLDTKTTDPTDHPWRMDYTLKASPQTPFDGQWHHASIPLYQFVDAGSWDNAWFPPQNKFDWHAVDRFALVAEHAPLDGKEFYFDELKIVKGTAGFDAQLPDFKDLRVFYRSEDQSLQVSFPVHTPVMANIQLLDVTGRALFRLYDGEISQGVFGQSFSLPANLLAHGTYFLRISLGGIMVTRKLVL
ncbi:MAG: cellulase family glycosylhydrolase [Bacteroidales bacterium]